MTLVAAAALGLAVWLLLPPRGGHPRSWGRRSAEAGPRPSGRLLPLVLVGLATGALVVLVDGTVLALGLVMLAAAAGAWRMVTRVRARREAEARADSVVEACEALAGELRAGQPPLSALRHCVEVCPMLEVVAAAGELGADVPTALRRAAAQPGAAALADVAAAWQVSEGSGGTMAVALARVAYASRRRRATQRLVASELASAQATARLVAALPVVVLLMGSGLGGDPWGFLLTTPMGLTCLALGLLLAFAGLSWIEKIAIGALDP